MKQLLEYLDANWVNFISLIIGLFGIVLAIIFYIKSKKSKLPLYYMESFNLLNEELTKLPNLRIEFKDQIVKCLTATRFAFWNGGKITINETDIPKDYELRVLVKDNTTIYDAEIIYTTEAANNVKIELKNDNKMLLVKYDYLDHDQGAIIKMLHSELTSHDLLVNGKVKGAGDFKLIPEKILIKDDVTPFPKDSKASKIFMFVLVSGFIIGGILVNSIVWKIILISLGVIYLFMTIHDIYKSRIPYNLLNKLSEQK